MQKYISLPSVSDYKKMSEEEREYWNRIAPYIVIVNPNSSENRALLMDPDDPYIASRVEGRKRKRTFLR